MGLQLVFILAGVALLSAGGDALIRGAVAAARRLGVSPLLTGLVIVGFGTSAPELVVSVDAVLNQKPELAVGNVVGSNISNVLLILAISALICPMAVTPQALKRDGVVMLVASTAFFALSFVGVMGWHAAVVFLAGLATYLTWAYRTERQGDTPAANMHRQEANSVAHVPMAGWLIAVCLAGGLALLIAGSRVLLHGAIGLASTLGVPEVVVGLTLVAVGTSLPELAVAVLAAIRRQADVAVGNLLGSNIFNLLGILGVAALIEPLPLSGRIASVDSPVMLGAALVMMVFLFTARRLNRLEGACLLAGYLAYMALSMPLGV